MRVLSWNVNGLRAAHRKGFLDWFSGADPDIMCLQETKAHEEQLPEEIRSIGGYSSYFSTPEKKGYSGVGLYTKKEPVSVQFGFGDRFDSEGRTIIADFGEFTLFNIYFPNGKRSAERLKYKMEFYAAFLEYAENIRKSGKHVVVCGDVNTAHKEIDLARPKENVKVSGFLPIEREWMDEFLACGYADTLRLFNQEPGNYSYWDQMTKARERNVGWRIDYFFVDQEFAPRLTDAFILSEVMGSDHCPVGIDIA
ncbi:MAG: exodeoxyribonuclease III [SAR202 cluster bacterium]|nr:exodeoxyribonuclease III [Chloroflexota bacterium]MQG32842.1 exodeoxyribonuclease III [SAR202 cluster bacterium]HCP24721.1 exodeoxyribonuclease III [Dehalococcoidia bacterium]|tara:strand:+ start:2254 stop:3012 length:759 start_codon:yes stop_codon:yes gene_type:complete